MIDSIGEAIDRISIDAASVRTAAHGVSLSRVPWPRSAARRKRSIESLRCSPQTEVLVRVGDFLVGYANRETSFVSTSGLLQLPSYPWRKHDIKWHDPTPFREECELTCDTSNMDGRTCTMTNRNGVGGVPECSEGSLHEQ